jgi:hypothetical protein
MAACLIASSSSLVVVVVVEEVVVGMSLLTNVPRAPSVLTKEPKEGSLGMAVGAGTAIASMLSSRMPVVASLTDDIASSIEQRVCGGGSGACVCTAGGFVLREGLVPSRAEGDWQLRAFTVNRGVLCVLMCVRVDACVCVGVRGDGPCVCVSV